MKIPFDILEIQKTIEEKRLVYGKKLEDFLLKKLGATALAVRRFFGRIYRHKSATLLTFIIFFCFTYFIRIDENFFNNNFAILRQALFPLALLSIITRKLLNKILYLKILFSITALSIALNPLWPSYLPFFFGLNLIFAIVFFILKEDKINWKKYLLPIMLGLIIPQFDAEKIFEFLLDSCLLWWVFILFQKKTDWHWIVIALGSITLSFLDKTGIISWTFSAAVLISLYMIYVKNYYELAGLLTISLVLSYVGYLMMYSL